MSSKAPMLLNTHPWLRNSHIWFVAIASGLAAIQLTLAWRSDNADLFAVSLLFLAVVASLLKERWPNLILQSSGGASTVGTLIITFVLLRSVGLPSTTFLLLAPFLGGLGLALLASGFSRLQQYSQEFTALAFLGFPRIILPMVMDPTPWTAKFATLILWYSGFQVARDGLNIQLGTGTVEVYPGCSGIESMVHVLSLTGLFLVLVPLSWMQRGVALVAGVAIAFIVNGFRVALMAYLVAQSQMEAFKYWHEGTGSLIFSMLSVAITGALCYLLMRLHEMEDDDLEMEVVEE